MSRLAADAEPGLRHHYEQRWDGSRTLNGGCKPMDNAQDKPIEVKPTLEVDIERGGVTISQYMSKHGIQGGVGLDESSGTPATAILGGKEGRRYEVGTLVAKGGMGAILQAKDLNIRRTVAMKVMLNPKKVSEPQILRFIEEAQVTGQLEHPSVVPVHELGVDAHDNVYYTMKFVKGITLDGILRGIADGNRETIAKYSLVHLLTMFGKACDAMAFAHAKGVVHRDLKPENIMVGDYGEVLVLDWGLAKVLKKGAEEEDAVGVEQSSVIESLRDDEAGDSLRTMDGQIMGTPRFMAPEQALGKVSEIDGRTDIYALGGILYNILTLRPPIEGKSMHQVLMNVTKGNIAPPATLNPAEVMSERRKASKSKAKGAREIQKQALEAATRARSGKSGDAAPFPHCPGNRIPAALSAVAMKALALKQEDRYPTVQELQKDIEAFLGGFATAAEEAGAWTQLRLLVKRHKAEAALLVVGFVVLLAVVAGFVVKVNQEKDQALQAREQALAAKAEAEAARTAQVELSKQAAPKFLVEAQRAMDMKKWDEALDAARTATALDPGLGGAWFTRGLLELGSQQFDAAEAAFGKAGALAPAGSDEQHKAKRYASLARQCAQIAQSGARDSVEHPASGSAGAPASSRAQVSDKDVAYALARALEKCEEYLVSARLYAESGKPRTGGMSLAAMAALKGLEHANPGLTAAQIAVEETAGESGPPEGGTTNLGHATLQVVCHADALIDITTLAGTPLAQLDLSLTQVRDLAPLAGLRLKALSLAKTRVTDLTPLKGMPLARLDLHGTNVADLAPLAGLPLEDLNLAGTKVRNLSPLERETPSSKSGPPKGGTTNLGADAGRLVVPPSGGPGLRRLRLSNTAVADLTPLKGQPIEELYLDGTAITDLAPLAGLPLKVLDIADTKVTDLTPLAGLKLESLRYTPANIAKGHDLAQSMPCAKAIPGRPWTIPDLGMQFVPITPGKFQREGGGAVTLTKPFWLGRFEVTQAEYQAVMGSNPSAYKGERLPVETVSWHDAVAFCAKLTDRERASGRLEPGAEYRLPTEAEWEYACRAGSTATFHFGNDAALLWRFGNYRDKSCDLEDGKEAYEKKDREHDDGFNRTASVGSFEPNPWGLYDMAGNVYEWCGDWHGEYPAAEVTDPTGPASGSLRVHRGGGWYRGAVSCRSANRCGYAPGDRWSTLGFRLLRTAP